LDAGIDYEGTRYTLDATQNVAGLFREGDPGGFSGFSGSNAANGVATDHFALFTSFFAPYVQTEISLLDGKLIVLPQLRLEAMSYVGYPGKTNQFSSSFFEVEPRVSVRWQLHPRLALTGAMGVYHQSPDYADMSAVFGNPHLSPEFSIHYVVGIDAQLTATQQLSAQGFYKELRNLVVRGETASDPTLENDGIGRVYGGELLIRQQLWKNFFGWISYTLSRSERRDHADQPWRLFEYDQTHILTILGSYRLPKGFQVGLRFRYASGNPYTPVTRAYYDTNSYSYVPLYGAVYSARLPAFNQLDLRVDKTFTFNRWKLLVYLDLENVYAAQSAEGVAYNYNFTKPEYLSGLPFLPVLGFRGEF
ncbi:MAG TPA: TonB-dependent receptor, partial [Polyangia bacterium]